jgi:hypothetical protein
MASRKQAHGAQDRFSQSPATSAPAVRRRGSSSTMGRGSSVVDASPAMVFNADVKLEVEDEQTGFEADAAAPRKQGAGAGPRAAASSASSPVVNAPPAMVFDADLKLEVEDVQPSFEAVAPAPGIQGDGAGARPAASSASRNNDSVSQTLPTSP